MGVDRRLGVILLFIMMGCDGGSSTSALPPAAPASAPAGMNKYAYVSADGGPHMLLPVQAALAWTGVSSAAAVMDPKSDYGRACAATTNVQMASIAVGSTRALVFADPPMTAWGTSADGLVEIYYLDSWTGMNLDGLIDKATAALPTGAMTKTAATFTMSQPDAFLLFAGDTPDSSAYGVERVTIAPGTYNVFTGTYSKNGEIVIIYRLQPATPSTQPTASSAGP
jgi:hypothetical protein